MSEPFQSERTTCLKLILWASLLLLPPAALLWLTPLNLQLFTELNSQLITWLGAPFWALFTNLGDGFFLFPLAMVMAINNPRRQLAITLTILIAVLVLNLSKNLIDAARPFAVLGEAVTVVGPTLKGHSTPSGHSGTVFLLAGLGWIFMGWRGGVITTLIATIAGLSRIAVGAHWPADVFLGAWVGLLCAALGVLLAHRFAPGTKTRVFFILLGGTAAFVLPGYNNGFQDFQQVRLLQYALAGTALLLTLPNVLVLARAFAIARAPAEAPGVITGEVSEKTPGGSVE